MLSIEFWLYLVPALCLSFLICKTGMTKILPHNERSKELLAVRPSNVLWYRGIAEYKASSLLLFFIAISFKLLISLGNVDLFIPQRHILRDLGKVPQTQDL